jgi:hypothetical protein
VQVRATFVFSLALQRNNPVLTEDIPLDCELKKQIDVFLFKHNQFFGSIITTRFGLRNLSAAHHYQHNLHSIIPYFILSVMAAQ